MATKPYFLWGGDTHATSLAALNSGEGIFKSSALETAPAAPAALTAASDTALVPPELGATAVARPRLRRDSSSGHEKRKKQQAGGGAVGAKKPPQRGLGVAELERLRCGGDPLLELSAVVGDAAAGAQGQGHPLFQYHHRHLQVPASGFEAVAGARFSSQLLAPAPPPPPPSGPVCVLHPPAAAGCQRAAPVALEQQYFRDRWSRMGGFSTAGGGGGGGGDLLPQSHSHLLPATLAPEHPSSQSTIWGPAVSSSCLHTGHRCDICSGQLTLPMRMRGMTENGGAPAPMPPDNSIYDLATAMATARQGDAFLARERKQGPAAETTEAPAKKDVREIEFFPAASANHTGRGDRVSVPGESELTAPFSSSYGAAASHTVPQLDLSLRL